MFGKKNNNANSFQSYGSWNQSGGFNNGQNSFGNNQSFNSGSGFQSSIPEYQNTNDAVQKHSSVAFETAYYKKKSIWPYILLALVLLGIIGCVLKFIVFRKASDITEVIDELTTPDEVEFVQKPKAAREIPFTLKNELNENCFFYLDSDDDDKDTSFLVNKGETVEVKVPEGTFDLYYASGDKWIDLKEKFGPNTQYFVGDEPYVIDEDHVWTVTVFRTTEDANITEIDSSDFPI